MRNHIQTTPSIRFKGFADAWEQRKLGDIGSVSMNRRIFKEQTAEKGDIPFYKIGTFGEKPDAFIPRALFEEYKSKYPYPEIGDILISASGSIGRTVEYTGKEEYFQDSNIVWVRHEGRIDNKFLKQFYSIVKWKGLEGSTIKRLYNKSILDTTINLPSIEEQSKIGVFFQHVDDAIALHQRQLDNYREWKKALLQKMFPKDGEKRPEVRFEGFTGEWEERKFSDIVSRISEQSNDSNLPKVEFKDIVSGEGKLNKDVSCKFDDRKGTAFEPEFILYGKLSPSSKNWLFPRFKGIALGDFWVFQPNNSSSIFNYYLIQSEKYQTVANITSGTIMPRSDWRIVAETVFNIPASIEEQESIGTFFKQLDDTIAHHQQQLDNYKELKKAMLQNMF